LAGIGWVGLFVAAPTLHTSNTAEAGYSDTPDSQPEGSANATKAEDRVTGSETTEAIADLQEFSAQRGRYWRRRFWRRRYWHRLYWRRRYWRRRHWRHRYWRRRHWRPAW